MTLAANRSGRFVVTPGILGLGLGVAAVAFFVWAVYRAATAREEG